jgi:hypothetical protein
MLTKINSLNRSFRLLTLLFFLVCAIVSLLPGNAFAVDKPKGLTLYPLRGELEIAPGTTLQGVITVTNSLSKTMEVNFSAEAFSVINQQYDYSFDSKADIANWVKFSQTEIALPAGKSQKVSYSIGAPVSAEPGGRYISLFASTEAGLQSEGITSRQQVASLLYITVQGDVSRLGKLASLSSPWLLSGTDTWSATVQNTGSTHFRSRYSVKVKDLFGGVIASSPGEALILPGTVRLVSGSIPAPQFPGIYQTEYTIGLGDTPAVIKKSYVLYVPPLFIIAVVAFAIVGIFWFKQLRSLKKKS